jgi:hypothetical protein
MEQHLLELPTAISSNVAGYLFDRVVRSYTKMWIIAVFSGFMELLNGFSVPPSYRYPTQKRRGNGYGSYLQHPPA